MGLKIAAVAIAFVLACVEVPAAQDSPSRAGLTRAGVRTTFAALV